MALHGGDEDERPPRTWRKSKYWSDVCKDLGKYILAGGVSAPFFGIGGAVLYVTVFIAAVVGGGGPLHIGYKVAPDEQR
jgi:hypothetical protein